MINIEEMENIIKELSKSTSSVKITKKDRQLAEMIISDRLDEKSKEYKKMYRAIAPYSFSHAKIEATAMLLAMHRKED